MSKKHNSKDKLITLTQKLRDNYLEQKELLDQLNDILEKDATKNEPISYLADKQKVPKSIRKLLDLEETSKLSRSQVTELIYEYIKDNDLIHKKSRKIEVNKALRKALKMTDEDELSFYNIQKWIDHTYQ